MRASRTRGGPGCRRAWCDSAQDVDAACPQGNADIESFNGSLRAACLNASWFLSMHDAKDRLERWRQDYNTARPHSALGNLTPRTFTRQAHEARTIAEKLDQLRGQVQRHHLLTFDVDLNWRVNSQ